MRLIPDSRRGTLGRFALGAVIVILFTATATAVAGLLQFKQFASDLSATPALGHARVTIANPGSPQTLLLIGSDHRAKDPANAAHTDTMMLVRMDPDSATINVLSIPRDLKVQIPRPQGAITDKINDTYSIGGPNLLVRVLRQQVFPHLQVNHIIDVNFGGFQAMVNALGCVYADVDHRYFNDTRLTNYSSINIPAGYQRLCGSDALAFVRFRHTDSDIVRNARQQDFLRWAKSQFTATDLVDRRDQLLRLFGQHTQTDADLHSIDGLINLFNLVAFSAGHTVKQVPFPAILLPCSGPGAQTPCYVGADPGAEARAYATFMRPTLPPPPRPAAAPGPKGPPPRRGGPPPPPALAPDPADAKAQADAIRVRMPVYYPKLLAPGASYEPLTPGIYPRGYGLRDPGGHFHPAYRIVVVINSALGQYYGIQGSAWQGPPILRSPTKFVTASGKRLAVYNSAGKTNLVAWHTPGGVYWIANTLTSDLSEGQMIGIAASLTRR